MTKTSQSHHTLLQRITQLKNDCLDIIHDKKPVVPKPLLEQLARMHAGFFMTDYPQAYTTDGHEATHLKSMPKPDRAEYIRKKKGLFPAHTMTRALVDEVDHISKKLNARGLHNFRVMASESGIRNFRQTAPVIHDADMHILSRSDIFGLHEFADLVEKRLKGEDPHPHKPLILQSHDGYWDPILKGMGLTRQNTRWLESHNIFMANRLSRVEAICEAANIDKTKIPAAAKPALEIKPGSTVLVATRQNRKIHELQRIFDALGANIRVLPFHVVIGRPREAEEISGTYVGNNFEKMQAVQDKIDGMSPQEFGSRLRRYGLSADKTFVLCDDRGEEFETNFFAEPEFSELRKHLNPHKRGLGVEMSNFLRAVANAGDMYHKIEKAFERMTKEGRKPTRNAYDYSCYAIAPITNLKNPLLMTATTEDEIVEKPTYNTRIGYSEDFLKLKGNAHSSKNTTPNFMAKHSSMAMAIAGIAKVTGLEAARDLEASKVSLAQDYAQTAYDNRQGRWKIGLPQSSSLEGSEGGKPSSLMSTANKGFRRYFDVVAGNKIYARDKEHSFTLLTGNGVKIPWYSALVSSDQFAKDVDAFYFRPTGAANNMMEEFGRDAAFFDTTVGKQTFGPHYHPKPFVVDKRYAKRQLDNYEYLHMLGLIGDAPSYLMDVVESKSEAERVFKRKLKTYVRPDDVDIPLSVEGAVPEGLFRIAVYASASNRGEGLIAAALRCGELCAENGFNAINGGGNDGLMKAFADGVIKYRQQERAARPNQIVVNGLTSIQCIDTIESEGEYPHADLKERHPTIYHRMDNLQKNDAEIFLAGGAGTLQEFYASCMERLRTGRIGNRPLILVNQDIAYGDRIYKVWDKLMSTLPAGALQRCNIHVVDTVDQAMDICIDARAKRGMGMMMKSNPYITANENTFEPVGTPKVA